MSNRTEYFPLETSLSHSITYDTNRYKSLTTSNLIRMPNWVFAIAMVLMRIKKPFAMKNLDDILDIFALESAKA